MKKRKALIIAYYSLGNSGVPNVIYQTIKLLHNEYDFDVVIFGSDSYYVDKLHEEDIYNFTIIRHEEDIPKNKVLKLLKLLYFLPKRRYKKTLQLMIKNKYEVIHSFKEYESWPFLKAAKRAGIKKRIVHTTVIHEEKKDFLIKRNKRLTLKFGNAFIGVSKDSCQNAFGFKKFSVVHFGYNENFFNLNVPCSLKKNDLVLTQVATFSTNKNQLFAIEILKELLKFKKDAKLQLVGIENEPGYFIKMINLINAYSLNNSVILLNGNCNSNDYLSKTSFYLVPSKKEGASLVVVEAQACGISSFVSTAIPKEMNLGGLNYINLNEGPSKWADSIFKYWKEKNNSRCFYDMTPFSYSTFKKRMLEIYSYKDI